MINANIIVRHKGKVLAHDLSEKLIIKMHANKKAKQSTITRPFKGDGVSFIANLAKFIMSFNSISFAIPEVILSHRFLDSM